MDGYLGYFHVLAIVDNATDDILLKMVLAGK